MGSYRETRAVTIIISQGNLASYLVDLKISSSEEEERYPDEHHSRTWGKTQSGATTEAGWIEVARLDDDISSSAQARHPARNSVSIHLEGSPHQLWIHADSS